MSTLVSVRDLKVHFPIRDGVVLNRQVGAVKAVDGVDLDIEEGRTLGLVGESGERCESFDRVGTGAHWGKVQDCTSSAPAP